MSSERVVILLTIILCVSIAIVSAIYLQEKPEVTVEVVGDLKDDEGIGAITKLTVKLTNFGSKQIKPVFSVLWCEYPYYWKIESGPQYLAEGRSATYQISADILEKAIPNRKTFIVRVNDEHRDVFYVSKPLTVYLTTLPIILNAKFQYWVRDYTWNLFKPFQWELTPMAGPEDTLLVLNESVSGQRALGIAVNRGGQPSRTDWTILHVKQRINFTDVVGIWVYPTFSYEEGTDPKNVYGVEINDGGHILWYIFSDKNEGIYDVSDYHRVIVVSTKLNIWSYRQIDLQQQYRALNWETPRTVWFMCIVGTRITGNYHGYFGNVTTI